MRQEKTEAKPVAAPLVKVELEIERVIVEQLNVMEKHTKISRNELVSTALKRFISSHKDYFPEDYKAPY